MLITLLFHHIAPNRVHVALGLREWVLIVFNIAMSVAALGVALFTLIPNESMRSVHSMRDFPTELLWICAWSISDEVIFICAHRAMHHKLLYSSVHKIHHKFKVTCAWTTYYSHPLDNQCVIWAAITLPILMTRNGIMVSTPCLAGFLQICNIYFIGSHHTTVTPAPTNLTRVTPAQQPKATAEQGKQGQIAMGAVDTTMHGLHHTRFNVNYGNFYIFDMMFGSIYWSETN
jgi:sterol desaturase/sphingolipid hydroxylase (fatty acid hydroxylase superfamily)